MTGDVCIKKRNIYYHPTIAAINHHYHRGVKICTYYLEAKGEDFLLTLDYFTTGANKTDHRYFGGVISPSDFDHTNYPTEEIPFGSRIAQRIVSDWRFDQICANNIRSRERNKQRDENRL